MHDTDQDLFDDLIVSSHFHEDIPLRKDSSATENSAKNEASHYYFSGSNFIKCYNVDDLQQCENLGGNLCWPQIESSGMDIELNQIHEDDEYSQLQRHKEEEELRILMEQDSCMIYEYSQKFVLLDLPEDSLVQILQHLEMGEVLKITRVCKQFRHVTSKKSFPNLLKL
jgi:hypothetical protein